MTRARTESRGTDLAERLQRGRRQAQNAIRSGARQLPVIHGVTPTCIFTGRQENVLAAARDILVESGKVFRYGNAVVLEMEHGTDKSLVTLATDHRVESAASSLLSNLFICESESADPNTPPCQYAPPQRFVELIVNNQPTVAALPRIELYATRPVFDKEFTFRGPGWHPEVGILVHGPEIEPYIPSPTAPADARALRRLPRRLRELLQDFCFRDDPDILAAVGVMLTGLLMAQFVQAGKPIVLLDGNQPGVGKTLLARVFGVVLDALDPDVIHYTADDEELAKRICATLRGKAQSLVIIDNARLKAGGSVSSPVIEANSMAAQVSLRILGQSANYSRPNDLIWAVTMNDTRTSPDLVSRGLPIRFYHEGDPRRREFGDRDPVVYAQEHRNEILGELVGMVDRWNQAGRPPGRRPHRCTRWASVIGGILEVNGLTGFLANLDEAASTFNTALDELAALAEAVFAMRGPMTYTDPDHEGDSRDNVQQ